MSEKDENNDEGAIHRIDTVPPPEGEGDAYNAPTRIGPMADSVLKEMMHALESKTAELSQRAAERAKPSPPSVPPTLVTEPAKTGRPEPAPAPPPAAAPAPPPAAAPAAPPAAKATSTVAGSSSASTSPPAAKPSSVPKRPLPPRQTPADGRSAPPVPAVMTAPAPTPAQAPAVSAVPSSSSSSSPASPTAESGAPPAIPSFYDDADDADDADAFAPTQLHANAEPPPAMPLPSMSQAPKSPPTEAVPSVAPKSLNEAAARQRSPIPFDPDSPIRPRESVPLLPLVVGFGIFFVGLLLYLLVR